MEDFDWNEHVERLKWKAIRFAFVVAIFLWALIFFAGRCFAHPVDSLCISSNQTSDDGCQPAVSGLGLDQPEFFAAHKEYWHCRRALVVDDIVEIAICTGAVHELQAALGEKLIAREDGLLKYWNVVPAHPELDRPGDVARVKGQTEACQAGRKIAESVLYNCNLLRQELALKLNRKLNTPPKKCKKK